MKKSNRGFGGHGECMAVIAVFAVVLAIAPVIPQVYWTIIRHGIGPAAATAQSLSYFACTLLAIFVGIPMCLALPCVCVAKLTPRRKEPFVEILNEFWLWVLVLLFAAGGAFGVFMLIWDNVIHPIISSFPPLTSRKDHITIYPPYCRSVQ